MLTEVRPAKRRRESRALVSVVILLVLLAVPSAICGLEMINDPIGALGMTTDWLVRTPIDTFLWPGIFLLGLAAAALLSAAGFVMGFRWRWISRAENFFGYRWPWVGAVSTGVVLMAWIIVEVILLPTVHPVLHPGLFVWGLVIAGLPFTASMKTQFRAHAPGRTTKELTNV